MGVPARFGRGCGEVGGAGQLRSDYLRALLLFVEYLQGLGTALTIVGHSTSMTQWKPYPISNLNLRREYVHPQASNTPDIILIPSFAVFTNPTWLCNQRNGEILGEGRGEGAWLG